MAGAAVIGGGASEEGRSEKVGVRERTNWLTCWELIMGDCNGGLGGIRFGDSSNLKGQRAVAVPLPTRAVECPDSSWLFQLIANWIGREEGNKQSQIPRAPHLGLGLNALDGRDAAVNLSRTAEWQIQDRSPVVRARPSRSAPIIGSNILSFFISRVFRDRLFSVLDATGEP